MERRRYRIEGRVQGVWFRESTRREAQPRGIRGFAVNRDDGTVDVLACGDPAALDALERWLHKGPPLARVKRVTRVEEGEDGGEEPPETFSTG